MPEEPVTNRNQSPPDWLVVGSETANLLRSTDWSRTPLGPLAEWPQSLRIALGVCLNSRFPMFVWWGPALINLYNDAYIPVLGKRHPAAFGKSAPTVWGEIWAVIGPQADAVMRRGEATWNDRVRLDMERHGYTEETYFTWSYSPIYDESGVIGGLFCACTEETQRVRAEERVRATLESISDAFFALDREWRFSYVNAETERVLNRDPGALLGKVLWDEYPGLQGSEFERHYRRAANERVVVSFTSYYPDHDRWYEVRTFPSADGLSIYFRDVTEQKRTDAEVARAKNEAERSLAHTRVVVSSMAEGLIAADATGFVAEWNSAALEMHGYKTVEEARRQVADFQDIFQLTLPDGSVLPLEDWPMSRALRGETFRGFEIRLRRLDTGVERVISYSGSPVLDPDGSIALAVLTLHDVTMQRLAQAALADSEARFRMMANSIPQLAWMARSDGDIFWYNERWYEYTGTTIESQKGWGWQSVHDPKELPRVIQKWTASIAAGVPWEDTFPLRRHDGEMRPHLSRAMPLRDEAGKVTLWMGTNTDVSERVKLEQRFRTTADSAPVLIWITDTSKDCIWFNKPWLAFTGRTMAQEEGNGWAESIHPDDLGRCIQIRMSNFDAQTHFKIEYRMRRHDGEWRWLLDNGTPLHEGPDGAFSGFIGSCTDVTDMKQAVVEREMLLEAERAARAEAERVGRMKDEFLATLSHELRTPLNAILGWSQILSNGGAKDAKDLDDGLRTIERNARAQSEIIADLLDMSRIISGKVRLDVQRLDVAAVVREAVETAKPSAAAKDIRLQVVLDPHAGAVSGDPNRLQQVFWNLLSNAIKFTPRGGRVQVLLERVNSHLEISVIDTGEGIDPNFLPHVFDRFRQGDPSTTRRHGGLGLGLAIVKQLVELHGGTIRAKSPGAGQGSTFIVMLPLMVLHPDEESEPQRRHPRTTPPVPPPSSECLSLDGVTVLVVDDEPDARALVRRLLENCRATVTTAGSAAEAMELFREKPPAVLVSDIGMPGEDGFALIRMVRALGKAGGGDTPAVALTAYARSEDRIRAIQYGFQMHVAKPVEPAELVMVVAALAGRNEPPSS